MKGNFRRILPLLHTLVEERAGERRLSTLLSGTSLEQFKEYSNDSRQTSSSHPGQVPSLQCF
jgi:hypothetical protein